MSKRSFFIVIIFLFIISCKPHNELPELGKVANFSFTKEDGQSMTSQDLKGNVWIADFIFTTCPKECPLMSQEMAKIQDKIETIANIKLISFTVDPDYDTPEILSKYAQTFGAKANKWNFLTGPKAELYSLSKDSFHLGVLELGKKDPEHQHHNHDEHSKHQNMKDINDKNMMAEANIKTSSPFLHSQKFVLVDQSMMIRGYYDSRETKDLEKLEKDYQALLTR